MEAHRKVEEVAFASSIPTRSYYLVLLYLFMLASWGLFAYSTQLREGLIVTGMRDRINWGIYIAMYIFFIGASMAGTMVSALLRLTKAGWRISIARLAELTTPAALVVAGLFIVCDMGRPDRIHHMFLFSRWQSPLIWDVYVLATYLIGSFIYLYLTLIPDLALCRDKLGGRVSTAKRWFFQIFSLGWQGTERQRKYLETGITVMAITIIPVAIMMHTVTSWVFSMTLREPWDSPLFGIYFVSGALFSGVGIIIIGAAIFRKVYHLEEYITTKHFIYLGYLLAALGAVMIYHNASEFLTSGYKMAGEAHFHIHQIFKGYLAPIYWVYLIVGIFIPLLIIILPQTRNIPGIVTAGVLVNAGMWLERYFIVVGGLRIPLLPYEPATYFPTWVEWSIMFGLFSLFALLVALPTKIFPILPIEELKEAPSK